MASNVIKVAIFIWYGIIALMVRYYTSIYSYIAQHQHVIPWNFPCKPIILSIVVFIIALLLLYVYIKIIMFFLKKYIPPFTLNVVQIEQSHGDLKDILAILPSLITGHSIYTLTLQEGLIIKLIAPWSARHTSNKIPIKAVSVTPLIYLEV